MCCSQVYRRCREEQFIAPQVKTAPGVPSVFKLTERYYRSYPEWEPATKVAARESGHSRQVLGSASQTDGLGCSVQSLVPDCEDQCLVFEREGTCEMHGVGAA